MWLDLSTGINPIAFSSGLQIEDYLATLPDADATRNLEAAARKFWAVPDVAGVLAAPGVSALIARIPSLAPPGAVDIPGPTYNEHARAFAAAPGWTVADAPTKNPAARIIVNPNNPDGRFWNEGDLDGADLGVIDESFCDVAPDRSLIHLAAQEHRVILKSFGKFWGLAGLRLGFAIGAPGVIDRLRFSLGPWPVSGPAIAIGALALGDRTWAKTTRTRLGHDAARLDRLMTGAGLKSVGGTDLFRLYETPDASALHERLARQHILTRIFPYSQNWIRLGLPGSAHDWQRLKAAH